MSGTPYTASDIMYSITMELTAAEKAHASKGDYSGDVAHQYEYEWDARYGATYVEWLGLEDDISFDITEFNSYEILMLVRAKEDFIGIMKKLAAYRVTDENLKNMAEALQLLKTEQSGSQ